MTDQRINSKTASFAADPPEDLPPYSIRRSARARYLRVLITPQEGIVVVLPKGMAEQRIEPFLHEHRPWLWLQLHRADTTPAGQERGQLPDAIQLAATGRKYKIHYQYDAESKNVSVISRRTGLWISGELSDTALICDKLRRWLRREARRYLPLRLAELAQQQGFIYSGCSIRLQKSRWGSCSGRGRINLNAKLMFLEPHMVDYVLLHELAHTRHRNHAAEFWSLLDRVCENAELLDKQLQKAVEMVPWWVEIEPGHIKLSL